MVETDQIRIDEIQRKLRHRYMESALQMPSSRNANWRVESHDAK